MTIELSWLEGDKSPRVDVELVVGSDALKPGKIPGLEGAKVELDVDTGDTTLVLNAQLSRDGELVLDCGFRLQDVNLKTDLRRGDLGHSTRNSTVDAWRGGPD